MLLRSTRVYEKAAAAVLLETGNTAPDVLAKIAILKELPNSKGFVRSSEQFAQFVDGLLALNPPLLDVLDAFAKLNYSAGVSSLAERIARFATSCSSADLCLLAHLSGNLGVTKAELWQVLIERYMNILATKTPKQISRFLHGLSNSQYPLPPLLTERIATELAQNLQTGNAVDLVMIHRALSRLGGALQELLPRIQAQIGTVNAKLPAKAIVSLYESLNLAAKIEIHDKFPEYLLEQSRTLHLDPNFNDCGCVVIARAVCRLAVFKDPRVLYQLTNFANTHTISKDCFIPLVDCFARLRIPDEKPWRRFVARLEKIGPTLTAAEIGKLETCFRRAKKLDDRTQGILRLFKEVREDIDLYGPC